MLAWWSDTPGQWARARFEGFLQFVIGVAPGWQTIRGVPRGG
jgi:hypothetical protein